MSNILKISEAASLALHAMIVLAKNREKPVSVKFIADELEVSANHLSKVMQRLVKSELVNSIKGNGGGFKLALSPGKITFLKVYEAIDGKFRPSGCLLSKNECEPEKCIMGDLVKSVNTQVELYFKNKNLDSFLKDKGEKQ